MHYNDTQLIGKILLCLLIGKRRRLPCGVCKQTFERVRLSLCWVWSKLGIKQKIFLMRHYFASPMGHISQYVVVWSVRLLNALSMWCRCCGSIDGRPACQSLRSRSYPECVFGVYVQWVTGVLCAILRIFRGNQSSLNTERWHIAYTAQTCVYFAMCTRFVLQCVKKWWAICFGNIYLHCCRLAHCLVCTKCKSVFVLKFISVSYLLYGIIFILFIPYHN